MTRSRGRTGRPWLRARDGIRKTGAPCWLCGKPIDYDLKSPDPMSFTVDHVIPNAHLDPRDPLLIDPSNLRPAHRKCNRARGTGEPQRPPQSRDW